MTKYNCLMYNDQYDIMSLTSIVIDLSFPTIMLYVVWIYVRFEVPIWHIFCLQEARAMRIKPPKNKNISDSLLSPVINLTILCVVFMNISSRIPL